MRLVVTAILTLAILCGQQQEPPRAPMTLTLEDVLKLVRSGVSEEIIVARIKRFNKPFDLNPEEILELKRGGVSDTVVRFLLDPTPPYVAPVPPSPPAPEAKPVVAAPEPPPKDPLTLKLPPEPGIYWLAQGTPGEANFAALEMKPVVPLKRGGKGGLLTGGLIKGHTVGLLAGPKAKVRVAAGALVFYARFGPKGSADDLVLVRLAGENGHRELDFGPKPDKPVFSPDAICQMETTDAGPGIYRIHAAGLKPGEYLFFLLGSGDEKKAVLGKGYDFGAP